MEQLSKYKVILWDFDGVIMDSMPIRDLGFIKTLAHFPKEQVDSLMIYHRLNGGLSRYVKFRYFFEVIRKEAITEEEILDYASKFSKVMLELLVNRDLLIQDSVSFIVDNYKKYDFHIVSGSDGNELNFICEELHLSQYFKSIQGSPTNKKELVKNILESYGYNLKEVCLIGDSINDKEAAESNNIGFFGYNNKALLSDAYINNFYNNG